MKTNCVQTTILNTVCSSFIYQKIKIDVSIYKLIYKSCTEAYHCMLLGTNLEVITCSALSTLPRSIKMTEVFDITSRL